MPNQRHTSAVLAPHLKQQPNRLERQKTVAQGDIGAFEGMNWGHQPGIVSPKEEEDVLF